MTSQISDEVCPFCTLDDPDVTVYGDALVH